MHSYGVLGLHWYITNNFISVYFVKDRLGGAEIEVYSAPELAGQADLAYCMIG